MGLNGWKNNFIVDPSTIKKFWKPKYLPYCKISQYISEMPQIGSNYTCLTVILVDFVL